MSEEKQLTVAEVIETSFLTCTHCHQHFSSPVLLPCLHIFCSKCIHELPDIQVTNGQTPTLSKFHCPLCQSAVTMTKEGTPLQFMANLCRLYTYKHVAEHSCSYCCFEGRDEKAVATCLQCSDDLCQSCAAAHRKTRVTRDHTVAPYDQIKNGLYDHDIRDSQVPLCTLHSAAVTAFCGDCSQLVCKCCHSKEHRNHNCEALEAAVSRLRPEAGSFVMGLRKQTAALNEYQTLLQSQLQALKQQEMTLKDAIKQQAEVIHALVTAHCLSTQALIEDTFKNEEDAIQHHSKELDVASKSLQNNAEFLDHLLALGSPCEMLQVSGAIMQRLKQLLHMEPRAMTHRLVASFHPGPASQQNMQILFGNLDFKHMPLDHEEASSNIQLTIATLLPETLSPAQLVDCVQTRLDDDAREVWPSGLCICKDLMVVVDRDNKKIKIFDHISKPPKLKFQFTGKAEHKLVNPFDAVLLENGVVVVTDYGAEKVKVFDVTGRWIGDLCGEFRHPRGIAVTSKGHLVVVDSLLLQVTLHDADSGKLLATIPATDNRGSKLLVDPFYVTMMEGDHIVVTDHAAPNIKVFNTEGKHVATYGRHGTSASEVLKPFGICVDRYGQLLLADSDNHRIHLLLPNGKFSKFLLTHRDKLAHPVTLAINSHGHLVVAEAFGKIKIFKYI